MLSLWLFKSQFDPEYIEVQLIIPIYCYLSIYPIIYLFQVNGCLPCENGETQYCITCILFHRLALHTLMHFYAGDFIESVKLIIKMSR